MSRKPVAKKKAKVPPKPLKVFIVVREMARVNNSFTEPDCVFATKKDALAHAKHLNRELRAFTNPFADQHEPGFIMSDEDDLFALLKTFKIPKPKPPKGSYVKWDQWWAQIMPELTEEQRDAIWDKFDEFDWYKVKETTLED